MMCSFLRTSISFLFLLTIFFVATPPSARALQDSDSDGLSDEQELTLYGTDPQNSDSDGDGFLDGEEIARGYSPNNPDRIKLKKIDTDKDGLNDLLEVQFKTSLISQDSDNDGYDDGHEIQKGFDPTNPQRKKLKKRIEINLKKQRLSYFLGDVSLGTMIISSGKRNFPTPTGEFKVLNKHPRAWSKMAQLWMPYWMGFHNGKFGIHELPEWPGGRKEGKDHLGKPVSHGCIRVGEKDAKFLYDWAPVGTRLTIK